MNQQMIMIFDFRYLWDILYQPIYDGIRSIAGRDPLYFEIELIFDEVITTAFSRLYQYQPSMQTGCVRVESYPNMTNFVKSIYDRLGDFIETELEKWLRGENAFPLDPSSRYKFLITPETLIVVRLRSQFNIARRL